MLRKFIAQKNKYVFGKMLSFNPHSDPLSKNDLFLGAGPLRLVSNQLLL